jgi:para-nitrobenzyl esterase
MDWVVSVAGGRLRGVWRGDLWSFSGIPYARAPTGPRRWLPPQTPESWVGVRDSSAFGPIAPQPPAMPGLTSASDPGGSEPQDEDCLSLNVWTPVLPEEPAPAGAGRPVMVWIHGGGFTSGSGSVFLYRGGNLVRNGDAVVVTINYRLGALGFLGLPGPEGLVGNWGLQDQVAALRWVRDNIAAFGGDPENVTVFGESAGAISVVALLTAPSASRLFRRAIVQSGGAHVHDREQAARSVSRLAAVLGLTTFDRDALIRVPAADLVAATTELGGRRPDPGLLPLPFLPVVDGTFLPRHPLEAVASGAASSVDLVVGTNRDELTLFALGNPALSGLDEDGVRAWVVNALPGADAAEVVSSYRAAREARNEPTTPNDIWVAAGSDIVFRWPSLQLAAAHGGRSFVYLFEWASPALGGALGSSHALELPFVFGAVHIPAVQMLTGSGPEVSLLSDQMQAAWLSFARGGNPSHEGIGEWPAWEREGRTTMVFGARTGAVPRPRDAELGVLERVRPLP